MTRDNDIVKALQRLLEEGRQINAGNVGFPRSVEWQTEFVTTCFDGLPHVLAALSTKPTGPARVSEAMVLKAAQAYMNADADGGSHMDWIRAALEAALAAREATQ